MLVFFALLVACDAPLSSTPEATQPPQIIYSIATPENTPTNIPATPTPTRVPPTPTAFATAPANGQPGIVPILMYHHLADLSSTASELVLTWTVAPKKFQAQMDWLSQQGYHTITMGQLVAYLRDRKPLPSKPIVITFDDGWLEQYVTAFPVLKKYNFIGTFFVYTNAIDHGQFMTWAQLQEMSSVGMDIQSHTQTHPHLRLLSADAAFKEISESKAIIEKRLGKPVTAFNYPDGEYNTAIIEMLKRAGYDSAVTIAAGYKQRANELYLLHRIRVSYKDSLDDFIKRLPQ